MKKNKSIMFTIVSLLIVNMLVPFTVFAEGYTSTLSAPGSSEKGKTFSINFGITDARNITGFEATITFDPNLVSYNEGSLSVPDGLTKDINVSGNQIKIGGYGADAVSVTGISSLTFTAVSAGQANFSVGGVVLATVEGTAEKPAGASASVNISEPLPGNANLASLTVDQGTLRPSFSAGTQNYTLPVAMGVSQINITAQPEDSKAKVQVSGNTGLRDGSNTIKIVVTAQNGSTKTYTITANRTGPTPTPAPTPTPEPTPTPPPSVDVDGSAFSIVELPEEVEVPAGFYEAAIEINGNMVTAWKSTRGGMILLYLSNEGPESGFYFYDEESGSFYRFAQLTVPGALFTRIPAEENIELPEGFVEARITIDGEHFDCWRYYSEDDEENESDLYLLYLMSEQGDKGFYLYQKSTRLIFPYEATKIKADPTPTPIPTPEATPTPVPEPESESPFANPFFISTLILAAITAILTGLLVWLTVRNRSGGGPKGPTDPDSDGMFQENVHVKPPKIRRVD